MVPFPQEHDSCPDFASWDVLALRAQCASVGLKAGSAHDMFHRLSRLWERVYLSTYGHVSDASEQRKRDREHDLFT